MDITECTPTVCTFGHQCVPSLGPTPAKLLTVTEAPGRMELFEGTPLVGPAGKLFNKFLAQAGIPRSEVFCANTAGCVDLDREDKRPLPAEIEACRPRLLDDIFERAKPQAILVMGAIAVQYFYPGLTVSKARGKIRNWNGIPVVATFHPAYALPHRSPEVGPLIVADIVTALSFTR